MENKGPTAKNVPSMPIENPGHMEVCILSLTEVTTTIFYLHCKTAFWTKWHADMRCVPRCARAGQAPQTCCQLQPSPTGTASEKIAPRSSAARDLGSNCPTATKTHRSARDTWKKRRRWDDDAPLRTRKDGNRRKFESSIRSSTTAAALCVHVSFLPGFSYNSNCFRTHRPPTHLWETISRTWWATPAHIAHAALFACMPYLWNFCPKHQKVRANSNQA